jgi:hypothetical protein
MASVTLPKRSEEVSQDARPPIWSVERNQSSLDTTAPLTALCDKHNRVQCCRDLKGELATLDDSAGSSLATGEDERTLIDPDIVRDVVIGLADGL